MSIGFRMRSDSNRAVTPQKVVRGLEKVKGLYFLSIEKKIVYWLQRSNLVQFVFSFNFQPSEGRRWPASEKIETVRK